MTCRSCEQQREFLDHGKCWDCLYAEIETFLDEIGPEQWSTFYKIDSDRLYESLTLWETIYDIPESDLIDLLTPRKAS